MAHFLSQLHVLSFILSYTIQFLFKELSLYMYSEKYLLYMYPIACECVCAHAHARVLVEARGLLGFIPQELSSLYFETESLPGMSPTIEV